MDLENQELLEFYEYLNVLEKDIEEKLKPYYRRLADRERCCMNTHGVATPRDKSLLDYSAAIYNLKFRIKSSDSLESLIKMLQEELVKSQDNFIIQKQLQYINDFYSSKNSNLGEIRR